MKCQYYRNIDFNGFIGKIFFASIGEVLGVENKIR